MPALKFSDVLVFHEVRLQVHQFAGHAGVVSLVVKLQHETADEAGIDFYLDFEVFAGDTAVQQFAAQVVEHLIAEGRSRSHGDGGNVFQRFVLIRKFQGDFRHIHFTAFAHQQLEVAHREGVQLVLKQGIEHSHFFITVYDRAFQQQPQIAVLGRSLERIDVGKHLFQFVLTDGKFNQRLGIAGGDSDNGHYQYIFEMDADFSHPPEKLVELLDACENKGAYLSVGSRYVKGGGVVNWPFNRLFLSWFASKYVRLVTGMRIKDTTAGFVCYRKETLQNIDFNKIKFVGYAFQIEMKYAVWLTEKKVIEIPIIFKDREAGTSKMSGSIIKEAVLGVLQMKLLAHKNKYRYLPNSNT